MSTSRDTDQQVSVRLTYDDYILIPEDGRRHEIINGRHYMNAAPNPRHQFVSRHIQFQLFSQIELAGLGQVINAPIDLQLSHHDIVQPDIVVVLKSNKIITDVKIDGVPDLVIEVLSPSNRRHDQSLKLGLYETSRIPEYWIVDPLALQVDQYVLNESGAYEQPNVCTREITFRGLSGGITVDLNKAW